MNDSIDIGKLEYFDLDDIIPNEESKESEFLINATANILAKNGGHNWIPLMVKKIEGNKYQVVGSNFIYSVAEAAELEKVWCIVIEPTPEAEETIKVLAKEVMPKINLSNATREDIKSALQYLISQPGSPLKTIDLLSTIQKLEKASKEYWTDFNPVISLKCGITKGKKLEAFKTAFYLTPLSPPPPPALPSIDELKALKVADLKKVAKERGVPNYTKMSKAALLEYFSKEST